MFYEKAQELNIKLNDYIPFPDIGNRPAWNALNALRKKEMISLAESYMPYSYPFIPATLFMDYYKTGNRVQFENAYMERRRKLNTFVLTECIENKGRFMDAIVDGIFLLCEESAWQLPPHNTYTRSFGENCLPDTTRPVLDLFACETGAQLAMIYSLMKNKLDEISEHICIRMEAEFLHRILYPYLNCHFWWMGREDEPMNNWTIWCTQNILLTVFLISSKPSKYKDGVWIHSRDDLTEASISITNTTGVENWQSIQKKVLLKASKSIDYFLKGYGEDGCCDEGAQYYRHAGLCLFHAMEVLNSITNQAFDFYGNSKIKNIAEYIYNVHVEDIYYINFADCSPVAGRAGAREFLFAKHVNSPDMMKFAALDYKASADKLLSEELNLFYRVQSLFANDEIEAYNTAVRLLHKDIYYKSAGVFAVSDSTYFLAAKAGHNQDSHNHNDTGSFTVYKNSRPFLIDIGVETYSQKTFSPQRYEIWTMQSAYHNLPTINGVMQKNGREYCAKDVEVNLDLNNPSIFMDIADAYPKEACIHKYLRKITLNKNKNIKIEDKFTYSTEVESTNCTLSLMAYEKPEIENNIIIIGELGQIRVLGNASLAYEEIPITDTRLQLAWKHNIYRILINTDSDKVILIIK